jgi:hypothetical protein
MFFFIKKTKDNQIILDSWPGIDLRFR